MNARRMDTLTPKASLLKQKPFWQLELVLTLPCKLLLSGLSASWSWS